VCGLLGREEEEQLRQHLKRKHAASILSLKEEFMRARKKGKLPKDATSALKTWWSANLVWPYPTDDDKRILGDETGLHPTQINNCAPGERERRHALTAAAQGSSTSASGTGTSCSPADRPRRRRRRRRGCARRTARSRRRCGWRKRHEVLEEGCGRVLRERAKYAEDRFMSGNAELGSNAVTLSNRQIAPPVCMYVCG